MCAAMTEAVPSWSFEGIEITTVVPENWNLRRVSWWLCHQVSNTATGTFVILRVPGALHISDKKTDVEDLSLFASSENWEGRPLGGNWMSMFSGWNRRKAEDNTNFQFGLLTLNPAYISLPRILTCFNNRIFPWGLQLFLIYITSSYFSLLSFSIRYTSLLLWLQYEYTLVYY